MKTFAIICAMILLTTQVAFAATIERGATVAVTDLGVHSGTSEPDVNLLNAEAASSEYVIAPALSPRIISTSKIAVLFTKR